MGWLAGVLSGYASRNREIQAEQMEQARLAQEREGKVYEALLNSPDEWVRNTAGVGLLNQAQPLRRKSGIAGWLGGVEQDPMWAILQKYASTPQEDENADPGLAAALAAANPTPPSAAPSTPTPPPSGAPKTQLPTPPGGAPAPSAALPATSPTQLGAPPPTPPQPMPTPLTPQAAYDQTIQAQAAQMGQEPAPGQPPASLIALPPPPPPDAAPPPASPGAPGAPVPPAAAAAGAAGAAGPGAAPLVAAAQAPPRGPHLPQIFPTTASLAGEQVRAKLDAEIQEWQEIYRRVGEPNWQQKGLQAVLSEHMKGGAIHEGDSQKVTGALARQLGVPDGTWMQPLYDNAGTIVHWIPATAKSAGAFSPAMRAAKLMGLESPDDVTPDRIQEFQGRLNEVNKGDAAAKAAGTSAGRYAEELSRVKRQDVEAAAKSIMEDAAQSGVWLTGRSQAFRDAVSDEITKRGGNIQRLTDSTRAAAELAHTVLKNMDTIAADVVELGKRGMMGPIEGRWNDFLLGKIGSADVGGRTPEDAGLFQKFKTEADLLKSAVIKAHAGMRGAGSPQILDHMEELLSSARMDPGAFLYSMAGMKLWMQGYADVLPSFGANWGTRGVEEDTASPAAAAATGPPASAPTTTGLAPEFSKPIRYDPKTGKMLP